MNLARPEISVVIPTRNRAGLLVEAIGSVLGQSAGKLANNLELLVVDDGSTDETEATVRAFGPPVRYFRQDQAGPAAARNRGIRQSSGSYLAFLDDDDLWSPDKLARQFEELSSDPAVDIVLGLTQRMIRRETVPGRHEFVSYGDPVKLESLGCGLFRKEVFERVGLLDEKMRHAEDDDWFMRARSLGIRLHFLTDVTLYYRFHDSNMSYDKDRRLPDMLRLLKNRLDRIRSGREDQ